MKKINLYSSKSGGGKSISMMIEAVKLASDGKRVAFITAELSDRFVVKRMNNIANYLGVKNLISRNTLIVFQVPFDNQELLFSKLDSLKEDFDFIFIDPFETCVSRYNQPSLLKARQDAFKKLVNVLCSDNFKAESIYSTVSCYTKSNGENVYVGSENLPEELKDKVKLKVFSSKINLAENSVITICDYDDRAVKEYNLTEIFK
jgi:hypothetical protein